MGDVPISNPKTNVCFVPKADINGGVIRKVRSLSVFVAIKLLDKICIWIHNGITMDVRW